MKKIISVLVAMLLITSCANDGKPYISSSRSQKGAGAYKIGNPYTVFGITYYPKEDYSYSERGVASWYGADFHEGLTANGEKYNMNDLTAAHRTLPLPSIVKVTNLRNNKSLVLRVNDRGPFVNNRIIDVSKKAAEILGFQNQGTTNVLVEIMPRESLALKNSLINGRSPITKYSGDDINNPNPFVLKHDPVEEYNLVNIDPEPATFDKGEFDSESDLDFKDAKLHYIQLGAFKNRVNAIKLKESLIIENNALSSLNIGIYPVDVDNSVLYRVRIGPYKKSMDALKIYNQVIDSGVKNAKIISDK